MRKILLLVFLCLTIGMNTYVQAQCNGNAPIINTFSPNTGFIGSTVTITGANFDPTPANNQVFFGATQATVQTASFGVLTVTVPVGATTAPISVKNGCNLTAYSPVSFNGIFCPTPLNANTYNNTAFQLGAVGAYNMLSQDLDGDGKPDVVSAYNGLTVARNTSTPGTLNFVGYHFGTGGNYNAYISTADFDGDGKRDLFGTHNIYRNLSTGVGNINFSIHNFASLVVGGATSGYQSNVGDFNNDGKIDVVIDNAGGTMFFYRNTSTGPGNISFAFAGSVGVGFRSTGVQIVDADADGKVDVLATQGDGNRLIALRNTTSVGATTFSFDALQAFSTGGAYPYRCQIADFDKDGKIDLATVNYGSALNTVNTAILRNTSSVGTISFATAITYQGPQSNYRLGVGDVNGDGYPDIVTKSLAVQPFAVYANTTTAPGSISFAPRFDYPSAATAEVSGIVIGDLDGDFVPDIATSGTNSGTIRFHRNTSAQTDNTPPTAICKNIIVALSPSGTVTVTPQMIDNGSGDACGIGSLQINNSASVTFTCANIGNNTVTLKVTDKAGNVTTCTATVTVAPAAIIVSGQTTVCQGQTVTMNANLGDSYQWYNNGVLIPGATSQTYVATVSGEYTVEVTNAGGCSGTSSATTVTVNNNPTVTTTPTGNASLCPPSGTVTLSASLSSIYQWKLNGNNIANATQQTLTVNAAGSYSVQVIDLFGCSATSNPIVVNATDNIPPIAKCKNVTVALSSGLTASVSVGDINDGSSDNCGIGSIVLAGTTSYNCSHVGQTIPVTLIVKDNAGNESTCVANVTVTDPNSYCNVPPVAVCKAVTVSANGNCQGVAVATDFDGGSTDADGDVLTYTISPAGPYEIGVTNVTLTVTDPDGASSSCATTITVVDNTAPSITCVGDISVNTATNTCGATVVYAAPTVSDNCAAPGGSFVFNYTGSMVKWTVPAGVGAIYIEASGAQGAAAESSVQGGKGARMKGKFNVTAGEEFIILVGEQGKIADGHSGGGGGGSFVVKVDPSSSDIIAVGPFAGTRVKPVLIAGGGGGTRVSVSQNGHPGVTGNYATTGSCSSPTGGGAIKSTNLGFGGQAPCISWGSGGGGFRGNGGSDGTYGTGGAGFLNGGDGGTRACGSGGTYGGFGGGGSGGGCAGGGGGGGYSGGDGGRVAGGGGSYNVGTDQDNTSGAQAGNGLVTITYAGISVVQTNGLPSGSVFPVGTTTNTFVATDQAGNSSTCSFTVTVTDAQPPVITCPGNISVIATGASGAVVNYATPSGSDNCPGAVTTLAAGLASGSTFPLGTTTVSYKVTDAAGLSATCSFTVTVVGVAPSIVCPSSIVVNNSNGLCGANVNFSATETTGIPASTITYSHQPGSFFPVGTTTVTATATNAVGSSVCTFTVTVVDNEAPKPNVTTLPTITAECAASAPTPTATDNCNGVINGVASGPTSFNTQGTHSITWTYTDAAGNSSSQTQTVVIDDNTPPVIACPFDIVVNAAPGTCGAVVNYNQPSATDNCGSGTLPTSIPGYTYKGTFGGHTYFLSNTQKLPEDAHAAAISLGGHLATISNAAENAFVAAMHPDRMWIGFTDRDVEGTYRWVTNEPITYTNWSGGEPNNCCGGPGEDWAVINWSGPTWNDWFYHQPAYYVIEFEGGNIPTTLVSGPASGSVFPVGSTTVTYSATDAGGNTVSCSFTVTVKDVEAPQLVGVPANATVQCNAVPVRADVTATDNCPGVGTVGFSEQTISGNCTGNYTLIRKWTVTDAHGNSASATQVITVQDTQAPSITTVAADMTVECDGAGNTAALNAWLASNGGAFATDACGSVTWSNDYEGLSDDCGRTGMARVTFTATDDCGNSSSTIAIFSILDRTAPVITCPADATVNCQDDTSPAALGSATATDVCSGVTITSSSTSSQHADPNNAGHYNYVITRTWTATDECGNTSSCVQTITVRDITAPVITCPADVTVNCQDDKSSETNGTASATDNCAPVTITESQTSTQHADPNNAGHYNYVITRTWRATDVSGNYSECVQTITVQDVTAPVAVCRNVTITLANGAASITPAMINNGSSDNCSPLILSVSRTSFSCADIGDHTVTLTVKDVSGNTSTCTATVTVVGEIPTCSIASVPANNTYTGGVSTNLYLGYGPQSTTLQLSVPASGAPYTFQWSGNGTLSSTTVQSPVFAPTTAGTYTFTVFITNKYGCTTTCSITICVTDIRVPGKNGVWDGKKVYVCHVPPGNPGNAHTLEISVNAVPAHIGPGGHATDRLGTCTQTPCTSTNSKAPVVADIRTTDDLSVVLSPNPTSKLFVLQVKSSDNKTPVVIRIMDGYGRMIETQKGSVEQLFRFGSSYISGVYYIEVMQGEKKKVVQGVKAN